jgi:hypothetical protein
MATPKQCGKCGWKPEAKLDRSGELVHIGDIREPRTGRVLESYYLCQKCNAEVEEASPDWFKELKL